jgi:hypothetical protein
MSFSHSGNADFIDSIINQDLLDCAVNWIGDNLLPEEVFEESLLEDWAETNGWVRKEY